MTQSVPGAIGTYSVEPTGIGGTRKVLAGGVWMVQPGAQGDLRSRTTMSLLVGLRYDRACEHHHAPPAFHHAPVRWASVAAANSARVKISSVSARPTDSHRRCSPRSVATRRCARSRCRATPDQWSAGPPQVVPGDQERRDVPSLRFIQLFVAGRHLRDDVEHLAGPGIHSDRPAAHLAPEIVAANAVVVAAVLGAPMSAVQSWHALRLGHSGPVVDDVDERAARLARYREEEPIQLRHPHLSLDGPRPNVMWPSTGYGHRAEMKVRYEVGAAVIPPLLVQLAPDRALTPRERVRIRDSDDVMDGIVFDLVRAAAVVRGLGPAVAV